MRLVLKNKDHGHAGHVEVNNVFVLDGDLAPGVELQVLVDEVVRELPDLVMSYKHDTGFNVDRVRQLTDRCFTMANGSGEDLASDLSQMEEQVQSGAENASVSETLWVDAK